MEAIKTQKSFAYIHNQIHETNNKKRIQIIHKKTLFTLETQMGKPTFNWIQLISFILALYRL